MDSDFTCVLMHVTRTAGIPFCDIFRQAANFLSVFSFCYTGFVHYLQNLRNYFAIKSRFRTVGIMLIGIRTTRSCMLSGLLSFFFVSLVTNCLGGN